MEQYNLDDLKKGFSEVKNPEFSIPHSFASDQSSIGTEKIDALKESIEELENMIKGRESLSSQVIEEGEGIKRQIDSYIKENEMTPLADKRDLMREKNDLRQRKVQISEIQLHEKVGCWKDIALLKRELREYKRELTERESRQEMFNKILEEED